MSDEPKRCYRDRDNGVYFGRNEHRHDCADPNCRGCVPCPDRHCAKAKNCAWHVGAGELTCGRCLADVRRDLWKIADLSPLMLPVALGAGVDSEAANLAGPSTDPVAWSERRIAMRSHLAAWERAGRITEDQHMFARATMEDDDEHHPLNVLGRWAMMLAEDYGHDLPARLTVSNVVAYLDRNLRRIANDDEQDFPLMAREFRKCRQHLESVLQNDDRPDRGVPCPACVDQGVTKPPRLQREFGHWCDAEDCERIHHADDTDDAWRCPRDREHVWSEYDYRLRVADWHERARTA